MYVIDYPSMKKEREKIEAVRLKGEVYVFGGHNNCMTVNSSVDKY